MVNTTAFKILAILALVSSTFAKENTVVPCDGWAAKNARYIKLTSFQFIPEFPVAGEEFKLIINQLPQRNYFVKDIRGVVFYGRLKVAEIDEDINQEFTKGKQDTTERVFPIPLALPGSYKTKIYSTDAKGEDIICLAVKFYFE